MATSPAASPHPVPAVQPAPQAPQQPAGRQLYGVTRWRQYFKARVTVAGTDYHLLTSANLCVAGLAVNVFRARLLQLDPKCGLSSVRENHVPGSTALSGSERLKVEMQVSSAMASRASRIAAVSAAQQHQHQQAPGDAHLQAALAKLGAVLASRREQLLHLLECLATGELPVDAPIAPITVFALASTTNYVRRRQGNWRGCRWPTQLEEIFAAARAQCSTERALDVLDGETASPIIPVTSRHSAVRLMREQAPEAGPFTGISKERVAATREAGAPTRACATVDGTELQVAAQRELVNGRYRLVGDADLGGLSGPSLVAELQSEQDDLQDLYSKAESCPPADSWAHQLAFLRGFAVYAAGPFLSRASQLLAELEVVAAAEQVRMAKQAAKRKRALGGGGIGGAAGGEEIGAAGAEAAVQTAKQARVLSLRGTMQSTELLGGLITVEALFCVIDAQRRLASNYVTVMLTSTDNSVRMVVGKLFVCGKLSEAVVRAAFGAVDVALEEAAPADQFLLASCSVDGEHFCLTNEPGADPVSEAPEIV